MDPRLMELTIEPRQSQELWSFSSSKHSMEKDRRQAHWPPSNASADEPSRLTEKAHQNCTKIPLFTSVEDRQTTPARQTTVDHRPDRLQRSFLVRCCLTSLDYVSAASRAKPLPHVPHAWFRGLPGIGDQHDRAQLRDMHKWPVKLLKTTPDTARSGVSAPRQCSPALSNGTPASRGGSRSSFRRWCWSPWLWTSCLSPALTPVQ
jgi:hypothetical protein